MATTTKAKSEDVVAGLEEALARLEDRLGQALEAGENANRRLGEINEQRVALSEQAFFGEVGATKEDKSLEAEAAFVARSADLARSAASTLEASASEVKTKLAEERRRAHETHLAELRQERQTIHEDALEAADRLLEVLSRDQQIHREMVSAAQGVSTRTLETVAQNHTEAELHRALAEKLRHFASAWI